MGQTPEAFEARIAEIKEGNRRRLEELEERVAPELSQAAFNAMAIYSAMESAS